jgi:predicted nucleic acid-binding protein
MAAYALDANIVSFYLKKNQTVVKRLQQEVHSKSIVVIAPFAYYEVKWGFKAIRAYKRLRELEELCKIIKVGKLSDDLIETAIDIRVAQRDQGLNPEDTDVYIAAFCMVYDYTLITNNTRHFTTIAGLSIADWSV